MSKLSRMPPLLAPMPSLLSTAPIEGRDKERLRNDLNPLRALYKTQRWRRLRWSILTRDLFTCQMCGRLEGDTSKLVADHRRTHRGDEALFWDEGNLQTLCASCHSGTKQRQEQAPSLR